MAKVVSTKFGDRRLVHLPPVALTGTETPAVKTLARPGGASTVVPKEYAYANQGPGNFVQPHGMGQQIYDTLLQQAEVSGLQGYSQGQYPVVPAVSDGQPHYMQYTPHGLNQPQTQFQVQPQAQVQLSPAQPPQYGPTNPNEKHIYYGPNGEILPGPPGGAKAPRENRGFENFSIDAELFFGRIKSIQLVDDSGSFPKIPDYLHTELVRKYGPYERTWVRIVSMNGEFHVHAVPQVPGSEYMSHPQYVPVFVDENNDYFHPSMPRPYRTPPVLERSYPHSDRTYQDRWGRPHTEDPMAPLRWKREGNYDDTNSVNDFLPVERPPVRSSSRRPRTLDTDY